MSNINDFFNKNFTYAIVGATDNPEKYGNKIFKTLLEDGYKVIPINPKLSQIEGIKCYPSLDSVTEKIDVVDFVVPQNITLEILKGLPKLNINKVWFQPNTYNDECIKFCNKNQILHIEDFCLLKTAIKNK